MEAGTFCETPDVTVLEAPSVEVPSQAISPLFLEAVGRVTLLGTEGAVIGDTKDYNGGQFAFDSAVK